MEIPSLTYHNHDISLFTFLKENTNKIKRYSTSKTHHSKIILNKHKNNLFAQTVNDLVAAYLTPLRLPQYTHQTTNMSDSHLLQPVFSYFLSLSSWYCFILFWVREEMYCFTMLVVWKRGRQVFLLLLG